MSIFLTAIAIEARQKCMISDINFNLDTNFKITGNYIKTKTSEKLLRFWVPSQAERPICDVQMRDKLN